MTGNNPFGRSSFLRGLAHELDPTAEQKQFGKACYQDLGRWLQIYLQEERHIDLQIYPQGSRAHGTSNRHPDTGAYDIDLVARVDVSKSDITQKDLVADLDTWLRAYVRDRQNTGHRLAPRHLEPGKRCRTLVYGNEFHMDVLPVVPVRPGELERRRWDASWLTDKHLIRWQATNPRGLADWFQELCTREQAGARELAKKVDVEPLPGEQSLTSLQMAVKLFKRHRDHMFAGDTNKLAPPSVILTVLTGRAFEQVWNPSMGLADLLEATLDVMPDLLNERDSQGNLVICNPRCEQENHADRYAGRKDRVAALQRWIVRAQGDVADLATIHGADHVTQRMTESFGSDLGTRVAKRLSSNIQAVRGSAGYTSAAGTLGSATGIRHTDHTFFGDASS